MNSDIKTNKTESLQKTLKSMNNLRLDDEDIKNTWRILSIISWLLLISCFLNSEITSINPSIANLLYDHNIYRIIIFSIYPKFLYLIIYFIGFYFYLIYTIYQQKAEVLNGLFDGFAKFHFLPLLGISSIYFCGESFYYIRP